jgi:hypothetical protein
MPLSHLELKIEFPLPETAWQPELSLFVLILKNESEKLFAEIAGLPHQEQQQRITAFERAFYQLDIIGYLAKQPDKGLKIITEWDAILVEGGLIED